MKCIGYLPKKQKDLQVTFDPKAWTPWILEPYKAGMTASSHSMEETRKQLFFVRRAGGELFLTVKSWDLDYAKQMATCGRTFTILSLAQKSANKISLRLHFQEAVPR